MTKAALNELLDEALKTGDATKVGEIIASERKHSAKSLFFGRIEKPTMRWIAEWVRVRSSNLFRVCEPREANHKRMLARKFFKTFSPIFAGKTNLLPLRAAVQFECTDCLGIALQQGTDVNGIFEDEVVKQEGALLHFAAGFGGTAVIDWLLARGANPEAVNLSGQTPIFFAARAGRACNLAHLRDCGANIHVRDMRGDTIMHVTPGQTSISSIAFSEMIAMGLDVNATNLKGHTPAMALYGCRIAGGIWMESMSDGMKILLAAGSDLLATDVNGYSFAKSAEALKLVGEAKRVFAAV